MAKTKTKIHLKVRIPHIVLDARGVDPTLLTHLEKGLDQLEARVRVLGQGGTRFPHAFSLEEAVEEANIWVVLTDRLPKDFSMLIERGIVPVLLQDLHPRAENYNASKETGNAFLFQSLNEWSIYGALVRALENFGFSYDWESLKNNGKDLL